MNLYPIFMNLEGRLCVIVGGGKVAERKVLSLLESGAKIKIISPDLTPVLRKKYALKEIKWMRSKWKESRISSNPTLVFAATDDINLNRLIYEKAREENIPVNIVDDPINSDFHIPSVFRRGMLSIAVSTSGVSPAVARHLKNHLRGLVGNEWTTFIKWIEEYRSIIMKSNLSPRKKKSLYRDFIKSDILKSLARNNRRAALKLFKKMKDKAANCVNP